MIPNMRCGSFHSSGRHCTDARWLSGKTNTAYALHTTSDGQLQQASVTFTASGIRGEVGIDLQAGTNLEEAQVAAPAAFNASKTWINSSCMAVVALHKPLPQIGAYRLKPGNLRQWYRHLSRPWVIQYGQNPVLPATSQLAHAVVADLVDQINN